MATSSSAAASAAASSPTASIVVGMAGAGKTTFMQRLNAHLHAKQRKPYILNLDPAVLNLPYAANIDIRDTINYKQVMKQYSLGPNGGILTSLNLFTTKFDQVLTLLEKRAAEDKMSHVLIDTPGQIEIFTWSASGAIITDALASSFPTVLTYVIDSPRSKSCSTFISSMLYAVSILYKTKLPMIVVFNKTDMHACDEQIEWMRDFESFQMALKREEERGETQGSGYMNSLMNSMSLVLEEFYSHLDVVGVSSLTGEGFDAYEEAMARKREQYETVYRPELEALRAQRDLDGEAAKKEQLHKLMQDIQVDNSQGDQYEPGETVSDAEADDAEGELIDPDENEDFESVEQRPGDPVQAARSQAGNSQLEQLAELMQGTGSLREARNL